MHAHRSNEGARNSSPCLLEHRDNANGISGSGEQKLPPRRVGEGPEITRLEIIKGVELPNGLLHRRQWLDDRSESA